MIGREGSEIPYKATAKESQQEREEEGLCQARVDDCDLKGRWKTHVESSYYHRCSNHKAWVHRKDLTFRDPVMEIPGSDSEKLEAKVQD